MKKKVNKALKRVSGGLSIGVAPGSNAVIDGTLKLVDNSVYEKEVYNQENINKDTTTIRKKNYILGG